MEVQNIGHGTLKISTHILHLKNILHVPMLTVNLLFVKKLCNDNNSWIICDDVQFFVQDKATWAILHHRKSSNHELFRVPVHIFPTLLNQGASSSAYLGQSVKSLLWHQRCGHPSNVVLITMLRDSNIVVTSDETVRICSRCLDGKMSRLPFSNRVDKVYIPFYKVHSDVWGPSPVVSVKGF